MNHNTACVRCVRVSLFSIFLHERTFSSTVSGSGGGQAGRIEGSRTILSATKTSSSPHLLTIINIPNQNERANSPPSAALTAPISIVRTTHHVISCALSVGAAGEDAARPVRPLRRPVSPKSRPPHPNPHHSSWSDGVMDRFCFKVKRRTRFERSKKRSSPPTR